MGKCSTWNDGGLGMVVAVDFDGTLHDGKWPGIGEPLEGAINIMKEIQELGVYIVIWTCRSGDDQTRMINWLLEHHIPFDRVNDNRPEQTAYFGNNSRKVNADLYIDDKQIGGLPSWIDIYEYVRKAKADFDKKLSEKK